MKQGFRYHCQIQAEVIFNSLFFKLKIFGCLISSVFTGLFTSTEPPFTPQKYTVIQYSVNPLHSHGR